MKKILIVFTAFLFLFTSCEDDDFCEDPTTPRLVIEFYDKEDPTLKKQLPIYVWADSKDSIYQLVITDSILVPMNTQSTSTKYRLATTNIIETIDLSYTTSDFFVSEACGYIAYFNDFGAELEPIADPEDSWIDRIEVNVTKIENETETHIKVFH